MELLLLVPVLISMSLFHESGWIKRRTRHILEGISIAAGCLYFSFLPNQTLNLFNISQLSVLFSASILLCFVCVRQGVADDDFYWNFHAALFMRLVITGIYTGIIIGGTSAALGAIDVLFKTHLIKTNEVRILILTLWIFSPIFFLSGVPVVSDSKETKGYNPEWLKNIGIYVMVPLTIVYLAILYAYGIKILVQWELPEGMVSYLVLSFASYGIVSLLVIFPFQKDKNSKWCYLFSRSFYILQLPLLLLLFVAIFTRVFEYGITFRRYYVLALAIWLLFLTVFMVIRKNRNLIIIPFSLLAVALLSILGPWSSFNVSSISQKGRLMKLLSDNGLIRNSKIVPAKENLPVKVKADISSIIKYLYDYEKLDDLAYLTSEKIMKPEEFTKELGFDFLQGYYNGQEPFHFGYDNKSFFVHTNDYKVFVRFRENVSSPQGKPSRVQADDIMIEYFPETAVFQITGANAQRSEIKMKQVVEYFKERKIKVAPIEYLHQDNVFEIYCLFENLSGWEDEKGMHFNSLNADFLIKKR
jgi:hypothetical protein